MATEQKQLEAMLKRAGIKFIYEKRGPVNGTMIRIKVQWTNDKPTGYYGFYTDWKFATDGSLEEVYIYE